MITNLECDAPFLEDLNPQERMQEVACRVGSVLIAEGLPCSIWSGKCVEVMCGGRMSNDVDGWAPDNAIKPIYRALREARLGLPVTLDGGYDDRIMIGIGPEREMEIMSCMDVKTPDGIFPLRYTGSVERYGQQYYQKGWNIPFNPADTIVLKAMLARGEDQGKYDLDDIAAIQANYPIDEDYLMRRIAETGSAPRVCPLLHVMGVITYSGYDAYDPVFAFETPTGFDSGDLR